MMEWVVSVGAQIDNNAFGFMAKNSSHYQGLAMMLIKKRYLEKYEMCVRLTIYTW